MGEGSRRQVWDGSSWSSFKDTPLTIFSLLKTVSKENSNAYTWRWNEILARMIAEAYMEELYQRPIRNICQRKRRTKMPIKGISEIVRLPRLGKIHLGSRKRIAKEFHTRCPPITSSVRKKWGKFLGETQRIASYASHRRCDSMGKPVF